VLKKVLFWGDRSGDDSDMQTRRNNQQQGMMLLPSLEAFVPERHRLRRLNRVLDLSFVHEVVRDRYCQENGRPSVDPEVIIRLFLLQAIMGIPHVRTLMEEVQVNLACRLFIGYGIDEALPDHSTLSKALDRFGDEVFTAVFARSIEQCRQSGLIEGKVLHVDATTIRADLDRNKVNQAGSPDPDARFGHFPGGTLEPGYKQQTVVDDRSQVVVGVSVMPANESEGQSVLAVVDAAVARLGESPAVVCADAAYGSGENRAGCEERGIRLVSPPPKAVTYTGGAYFTVEDFGYDEERDVFVCPAGATLSYVGGVLSRPKQRRYAASRSRCRSCALRRHCTKASRREVKVGKNHAALVRLRADSRTVSFRQMYRRRAPVIEGIFAEGKQWHGLRRAWRRGLGKMLIQSLLVASVLNFKRLVAALPTGWNMLTALLRALYRLIRRIWAILNHDSQNDHLVMTANTA
jgi:transposase